ncbi:MAG TPA: START domain-containing protein [Chitinophagaceae bacterium]|jgi:START domain|nr:START domain-containing protein [Chitinophagaceae bacterium]
MKINRALYVCLELLLMGGSLSAQNNWILKRDKEGIKISTRRSDRSRFNDIKVEMDLPGNIGQLTAILVDVNKYSQWSYSTKKSVLIKKITPNKLIYYSEISAPWPVTNRDLYAIMEINTDSVLHLLKVVSVGDKNYQPPISDLVRIPYSKGVWNITTVSNKVIHLNYVLEVDPGGSVPAWILNLFSTKAPLETFKNLRDKMALLNPAGKI